MRGPVWAWSTATRGMTIPAWRIDHWTRPEQSNTLGPAPPHTYGRPTLLSAAVRNDLTCATVIPGPVAEVRPRAPADPWVTGSPRAGAWPTSGATEAPSGSASLTLRIKTLRVACGALMTIAFPAGMPSDLATVSDTTASTPLMPTVPKPPTGSSSVCEPVTLTVPPTRSF